MIQWFAKGINYCIPKGSTVDFVLDNCTDRSKYFVEELRNSPHSLKDYTFNWYESQKSYRWQNTNDAIDRFMQSDCDLFLSPQDDQKLQDSHLVADLIKIHQNHSNVGIIGMRDGITQGQYWSAHHSQIGPNTYWLRSGEYFPVDEINDGPICINKNTVNKVGLFDVDSFIAFYTDKDYSIRCRKAGLQNFVLGTEIVHEKWGIVQASTIYTQEIASHDFQAFKNKYPNGEK